MKLLMKEIVEKIHKFDKENWFFRFKSYDVYDYKGELFVEYVTQQDHDGDGKFVLIDLLSKISFKEDVNIHLHYIVRDNYSLDNIGYYDNPITKRGFELIK